MGSRSNWPNLFKVNPSPSTKPTENAFAGEGTSPPRATQENNRVKPRWHPVEEQKEILEELFKSGMERPNSEEVGRITRMLQEYGHVEERNIFYWFQNRLTRERRKQKQDSQCNSKPNSGDVSAPSMPLLQQMNTMCCARYHNTLVTMAAIPNDNSTVHTEYGDSNQNTSPLTVFINGIAFDASIWPLNVKPVFGEKTVLLNSSGQRVPADQHGFMLKKLEHRREYHLVYI